MHKQKEKGMVCNNSQKKYFHFLLIFYDNNIESDQETSHIHCYAKQVLL